MAALLGRTLLNGAGLGAGYLYGYMASVSAKKKARWFGEDQAFSAFSIQAFQKLDQERVKQKYSRLSLLCQAIGFFLVNSGMYGIIFSVDWPVRCGAAGCIRPEPVD